MSDLAPLTRRATAEYRRATCEQVEAGRQWYPDANAIALDMMVQYGVTLEQSSSIIAALSPRMSWGSNVMFAERLLASGGTLDRGCLGRSIRQATRIYQGEHPLAVLGGLKTRAFYEAILTSGQSDTAVIDVHAWAMLIGERGTRPPNRGDYRAADVCMRRAARIVGENLHDFQAITWLTWRSRFWRPGTNDHRPQLPLEGSESW